MTIPNLQTLMLPSLQLAQDGQEHSVREAIDRLAKQFGLTDVERTELLPSGQQPVFDNRVHWALTYLKHAVLLERTGRGHFQITARGAEVIKQRPQRIDVPFLLRYSEFVAFREHHGGKSEVGQAEKLEAPNRQTPEELIEVAYQDIRGDLVQELRLRVQSCSPSFFERLVVELLVNMGYGGSRQDAGQATRRSGDEGIDGVIKEDRLGLDTIYVQAKRWSGSVGRPDMQRFIGALAGQKARKGVFLTTSDFSPEAQKYAASVDSRVVLIDGTQLAQLMIDHNVGVSTLARYDIKRIDSDYFTEPDET